MQISSRLGFLVLAVSFFVGPAAALGQHGHGGTVTFEDVKRWVAAFEDPGRADWQKPAEVVAAMALRPGDVVADIGAGSGYFTRLFARVVGQKGTVYAADIEPGMLRHIQTSARETGLGNIVTVLSAPNDPMLGIENADVIFICNTIHHIDNRGEYYRTLARALRPGGRLIIVDFVKKKTPVGPPVGMRIPRAEMVREVAASDFQLSRNLDFLPYQYFLEFRVVKGERQIGP